MSLNSKYRILTFLLALAFVMPIVIKTQHMMFPNHEHHCQSCSHNESGLLNICEIQDFDYFYFTVSEIIHIPNTVSFQLAELEIGTTISTKSELWFDYGLRAPPLFIES